MKKLPPLIITFSFILNFTHAFSQSTVCESKKSIITDINDIGVTKCEIDNAQNQTKRVIHATPITSKTRFRKVNATKKNVNHIKSKSNVQIHITNNSPEIKIPTLNKTVLFNLVQEAPLFKGCKQSSNEENKQCFKTQLNKHIAKYFHPEELTLSNIKEKIIIQFTIGINGNISSIKISSKTNNTLINKELKKIIAKIPNLTPGKEQGLPVNVIYSFPLNLTLI